MPKAPAINVGSVKTLKTKKKEVKVTEKVLKYPKLEITERSTSKDSGVLPPLSPSEWKEILGWEPESDYQVRMMAENPGTKPEQWVYGEEYHCINKKGEKVRCRNNPNNRPFDMIWCRAQIHTVLNGLWAGPHTIPGETVNGETVRIGRYGNVLSGQHQGTAVILADEELQADRSREDYTTKNAKYPFWNNQPYPFIETILITGLSEDERVLRTIDYVKPRTAADMLYTMPLYRNNNSADRRELTRMLSAAIEMLWDRTKAQGYRTHPEVVGFLERHEKLLEMVEHLFTENSSGGSDGGRKISKLNLSPGKCAAMCYLMACSDSFDYSEEEGSGRSNYRNKYLNKIPPTEKVLDWSMLDRAKEFWTRLASGRSFIPVRHALGCLVDSTPNNEDNQGQGGRLGEKLAILSNAWERWKNVPGINGPNGDAIPPFTIIQHEDGSYSYPDIKDEDGCLHLHYNDLDDKGNKLPDGQIKLLDIADFGGIDHPRHTDKKKAATEQPPTDKSPSKEEIEQATAEASRRRREEHRKKLMENRNKRK